MKTFRAMLGDWFEDIEADTEEEAIEKMRQLVCNALLERPEGIIAWETSPNPTSEGSKP